MANFQYIFPFYEVYISVFRIYHFLFYITINMGAQISNILTMAEFLVHRRSGMGFPAKRVQGKVSGCPSMTLATAGLIPIRGATESERAKELTTFKKDGKLFHGPK